MANNNRWYANTGQDGDVVLSTRIRLARNLAEYPFPHRLDVAGKEKIGKEVYAAVKDVPALKLKFIEMKNVSKTGAVALAERHLISPEFASNSEGRSLLLSDDESVSIMICEEDHIRLQIIMGGLSLNEAYEKASLIDDVLDERLKYAFNENFGYLTQCPTNLGTGMRASVMLHLPALSKLSRIQKIANAVSKLGLTVRGAYGEGTSPGGDIYQLSNQVSLGISEQEALDNLRSITLQLATQERSARKELLKNISVQDKVSRAYGILLTSRILSSKELMELLSWVRLGASEGLVPVKTELINEMFVTMQPANLLESIDSDADAAKRDEIRAERVRKALEAGRIGERI
ncbi:MAG: protein arginine kinase [Clostridiales bacterium]|jgi:protein arginine kinase|nr:protein arginine kinase [Clostridiales bacterium]